MRWAWPRYMPGSGWVPCCAQGVCCCLTAPPVPGIPCRCLHGIRNWHDHLREVVRWAWLRRWSA